MRQVANGDTVRVHYTGTFADGSEFDTSVGREPIEVTIGTGQVIPGFENALVGMAEGDAKSVTLEPEHAYGEPDDRLVHVVERTRIPADVNLDVGSVLEASDSAGNQMRLTVVEFDNDNVTLDANHPLAGKALTFDLQLVGFVGS
jgi:peptidylprolyl isomerase